MTNGTSSSPLVTIGITAYNAQDTIARAIDSALKQTYLHTEIIVVDDCSVDTTRDVIERLIDQNQGKIRIIRHTENRGVGVARNSILKNAHGAFIVFFDDDDESTPDRIEKQVKSIIDFEAELGPDALIISHAARHQTYPDGSTRIQMPMGSTTTSHAPHGTNVATWILTGRPNIQNRGACATCSQMARASTYKRVGGFDANFRRSEDTEFCIRFAKLGGWFVGISEPLVYQTMTPGSEKSALQERDFMIMCIVKHADIIPLASNVPFCMAWIKNKYRLILGHKLSFLVRLFLLWLRYPRLTTLRIFSAMKTPAWLAHTMRFHKS